MDVLLYLNRGIAERNIAAAKTGKENKEAGTFMAESPFATHANEIFNAIAQTPAQNRTLNTPAHPIDECLT